MNGLSKFQNQLIICYSSVAIRILCFLYSEWEKISLTTCKMYKRLRLSSKNIHELAEKRKFYTYEAKTNCLRDEHCSYISKRKYKPYIFCKNDAEIFRDQDYDVYVKPGIHFSFFV